jgi:hypothetical protein
MTTSKKICPTCQGKKTIKGTCQCSSEWRGNQLADGSWDDCQCTPEQKCPTCGGTGYVK